MVAKMLSQRLAERALACLTFIGNAGEMHPFSRFNKKPHFVRRVLTEFEQQRTVNLINVQNPCADDRIPQLSQHNVYVGRRHTRLHEVSPVAQTIRAWLAKIKPEDRIYYTRLIFAVVAASVCLGFNLSGQIGILGFILGVIIVVLSYFFAVYLLGVDPKSIGGHAKGITKGLGTALLLFLVIWLLAYNFLVAGIV
jgi:hypothetical protein